MVLAGGADIFGQVVESHWPRLKIVIGHLICLYWLLRSYRINTPQPRDCWLRLFPAYQALFEHSPARFLRTVTHTHEDQLNAKAPLVQTKQAGSFEYILQPGRIAPPRLITKNGLAENELK